MAERARPRYAQSRSASDDKKSRFSTASDRGNTVVVVIGVLLLAAILYIWYEDYEGRDRASEGSNYGAEYLSSAGTSKESGLNGVQQATRLLRQAKRSLASLEDHVDHLVGKAHPHHASARHAGGADVDADAEAGGGGGGGGGGGSQQGQEGGGSGNAEDARYAYVTVVSVETYIDGALVMGESLKAKSQLVKSGECALVCVASKPAITDESIQRLHEAGWTVVEVKSLGKRVPKSHWADSFDKLYIFGLTQFKRAVFMDSDMMALESPDDIFSKVKLPNSSYIGAIGSNPKSKKHKPYFQSGMIVYIPTKKVYSDLMKRFAAESLPAKRHGKLNTINSRDGSMLRDYFGLHYVPVTNAYSKHLAPWEDWAGIKMVHFRGSFKPWHDPQAALQKSSNELTFGPAFRLWWGYYRKLHLAETKELTGKWGPKGNADPKTHYWLLRGTAKPYVRPSFEHSVRTRNLTKPHLVLVKGKVGHSCEAACKAHSDDDEALWCDEEALSFSHLSDCKLLKSAFGCKECDYADHREGFAASEAPCFLPESRKCLRNFMTDPRMPVSCSDEHKTASRLCPCATKAGLSAKPRPYAGPFTIASSDD